MNVTKEQIDYIKKAVDHVDFLTGGSRNSKTKQIIEELQQENSQLKERNNKLEQWLNEQIDYLTKIDGQRIPLNDNFEFCSMNELYQTGKYSGFKECLEKIQKGDN